MLSQCIAYPGQCAPKKKRKKKTSVKYNITKRKKFSFSYYFKHVLWKTLRRYFKRTLMPYNEEKNGKSSSMYYGKSSPYKIGHRDFWGSHYGSEWFLKKRQSANNHRLLEIVDAFKSVDLMYSKRHRKHLGQNRHQSSLSRIGRRNSFKGSHNISYLETLRSYPYIINGPTQKPVISSCSCRNSRLRSHASSDKETDSDWSLSTMQRQRRPYSRWPPSRPPRLDGNRSVGPLPLESVLSRMNTYVYNWLYMDQMQSLYEVTDGERKRISPEKMLIANSSSRSTLNTRDVHRKRNRRSSRGRNSSTTNRAKEKASILWLLSKAFDGVIPSDLREPFYRDHEKQIRLKPKIVHSLANAELYCLSLANIYGDPNYHSLDHHGIIQTLVRKGIYLVETREAPLTETVLVQTAPIRLNAHMAVIDGIMSLYIKEVLIPEKVIEVVRSFSYVNLSSETPSNAEEAAVLWINKCCRTLENEIKQKAEEKESSSIPRIPVLQEISDISDGCSLAAVISFYCPNYISWQDICWNEPMSLSDSIYNFKLIRMFCKSLPRDIYFLTLEDFLYLHPSIKENVLAFVADLLYLFVICPADCVTRSFRGPSDYTSHMHLEDSRSPKNLISTHKAQVPCSPIPNLRADSYGGSTSSLPDRVGSRGPSGQKEKLLEKHSNFRKSSLSNEICDMSGLHRTGSADIVNGRSPNTSEPSLSSSGKYQRQYRSGDGNFSYDGSQSSFTQSPTRVSEKNASELRGDEEPISNSGYSRKSESKDVSYSRRKFNNSLSHGANVVENNIFQNVNVSHGRQSVCLEDYYKKLGTEDGILRSSSASSIGEQRNWRNCNDKFILGRDFARNHAMVLDPCGTFSPGVCIDDINNKNALSTTSFAEISKFKGPNSNAINIVYMQHDRDDNNPERDKHPLKSSFLQKQKEKHKSASSQEKRTTFAALPNTTTWQEQQAVSSNSPQTDSGHETPTEPGDSALNTQLYNVRMKLEEKRRKIEQEKRRMELLWKRQRQKLGKAAFLQAVSKSGPAEVETPDSGTGKEVCEGESPLTDRHVLASSRSPSSIRRMSIQEIAEDLDSVQKRWLETGEPSFEKIPAVANIPDTPADIEIDDSVNINIEEFQTSIEHLNSSLNDLQADISRLSVQQEHVETLMHNHVETSDGSHFFLHDHYPQVTDSLQDSLQWDERGVEANEPLGQPSRWEPQTLIQNESISAHVPSRKTVITELQYEKSSASLPPVKKELDPSNECLYSKVVKRDPHNLNSPQIHVKRQFYVSPLGPDSASAAQKPAQNLPSSPVVPDNRKSSGFTDSLRQSSLSPRHISHPAKEQQPRTVKPRAVDQKEQKPKPVSRKSEKDEVDDASVGGTFPSVSPSHGMHPAKQPETPSKGENAFGFVIGADLVHPDPETEVEMARKKEVIMLMSLRRRADQETKRVAKEQENARRREQEERKREYMEKKKEDERLRRQAILEQYRQRKIQEELEKEGGTGAIQPLGSREQGTVSKIGASKASKSRATSKPRPKSAYIITGGSDQASLSSLDSQANKRNSCYLTSGGDGHDFDTDSLNSTSTTSSRKAASPSHTSNHVLPLQGASSPGGTVGSKDTAPSSDGTSDTASTTSSAVAAEYTGPKLFVKPTAKSNRGIITNAINTVLAGAVNAETKKKVLEEINRSESKHFLILFRDAGCQFRAIYSYNPDREEVTKMYGIGPKAISDHMMDRFYKYNSGGKCFSEVQTKHLTVTIDAFTIPNSLWAGKKVIPPRKEFF